MSVPRLSQTALYEVLVSEVESLKTTKREYDRILREINGNLSRLEALYKEPIAVDTRDMQFEHGRIRSTLQRGLYIPKWLVISLLFVTITAIGSLFFNYKQYQTNIKYYNWLGEANGYIEELEEKLPKNKPRK